MVLLMLEKREHAVDIKNVFATLPTVLLNAYECNMHVSCLSLTALELAHNYFPKSKDRMNFGLLHRVWVLIVSGVYQKFILQLLLLNIFLCSLILVVEINYLKSHASDTSPKKCKRRSIRTKNYH